MTHSRFKHGHDYSSPTYRSWKMMKVRCTRPQDRQFKDYGGRGISVCDRWLSFANFLADMGERLEGTTLDRIDVNGNYEPGNCRWADIKTQRRNRTDNHIVVYQGQAMPLVQACELSGVKYDVARDRLNRYGWTPERTFATQHDARGRHERANR